jgi:O-antigen ligase
MTEKRVIILCLISGVLLLSPLFLPSAVKQRILFTFNQPREADQIAIGDVRIDTSTSARLQSWKNALRDFQKHPILGYGVTGYPFVDAQFPRVLVETGVFGLFAFLYLLYSVFRLALRHLRETEEPYDRGLITGFIAGFVGLVVHAIGGNTFIIVRIMEPFWFLVGIITVLPMLKQEERAPAAVPIPRGRQVFTAPRRFPVRPRLS